GDDIPAEYKGRFHIQSGFDAVPWPLQFLYQRPKDSEYQRALIPSEFVEPLTQEVWKDIKERLIELATKKYRGVSKDQIESVCAEVIAGLMGTKRVFLLGDPGVGKSEFTKLVVEAFESVLDEDRLLSVSIDITDKSSETNLLGFAGLDGQWIDGA